MRQLFLIILLCFTSLACAGDKGAQEKPTEGKQVTAQEIQSKRIEAWVELDPAIKNQVDEDWQVFVYAMNPNGRVPLASFTVEVYELPMRVVLTEGMYILPAYNLTTSDQFRVTAKVTSTGKPHQTVKADRIGHSKVFSLKSGETAKVKVIIDRPALSH